MKASCYLLIIKNGEIDFRKSSYSAKIGQIPIKINIEIPDKAFKEPTLTANLKIDEKDFNSFIEYAEFELKKLKEEPT